MYLCNAVNFRGNQPWSAPITSRHLSWRHVVNIQNGAWGMNRGVEVVRSLSRNLCLISLRSVRNIMDVFDALRNRKGRVRGENKAREEKRNVEKEKKPSKVDVYNVEAGTYWLTRIVFLRSLSFIYCKFYKFLVTIFYLFTMQFSPALFRNFDKGRMCYLWPHSVYESLSISRIPCVSAGCSCWRKFQHSTILISCIHCWTQTLFISAVYSLGMEQERTY